MTTSTSMATAVGRHGQAVWAIMLRDFRTRYGGRRLGMFWAFFEPAMYVFVFSVILSLIRQRTTPLGSEVAPFIALGIMNYMMFNAVERFIRRGLKQNKNLLSFPRIKPIDIYVGRFATEIATLLVVFVLMFWLFIALGWIGYPDEPHRLLLPLFLSAVMGFSVGIFNGAVVALVDIWSTVYQFFQRALFFTSGVFFLASGMPTQLRQYLYYNPLLHNAEWVRSAYYDTFESRFLDVEYTVLVTIVVLFIALIVERAVRKLVLNAL
jgi:capsular polysaccharide transport system permease protein